MCLDILGAHIWVVGLAMQNWVRQEDDPKAQCQGCAHPNPRSHFHQSKKGAKKVRMLRMRRVRALCGSLSKQDHTQDKEEGMQEPSPHINKVMGWFFKWRRTPSQEARLQALIIKALLVCALWYEVMKAHPLVRVIVMIKYLLMMKLCNKILIMLQFTLVNKRSLKN